MDPPQYGIELGTSSVIRYTEQSRLVPCAIPHSKPAGLPQMLCPVCCTAVPSPYLQDIAPGAMQKMEQALTDRWLQQHGVIRCPTPDCGALIERMLPAAVQASRNTSDSEQHMEHHRYRCSLCNHDFCDDCRASPYHKGYTCEQHAAPKCLYCDNKVLEGCSEGGVSVGGSSRNMSVRQLRTAIRQTGADCTWCLERHELVALYQRVRQVRNYWKKFC
eukprot:jgi/Chrzof1/8354/Cz03g07100.t1